MKKIILIAIAAISLTSCMGLHTYKMQQVSPITGKVIGISPSITVTDWASFRAGQIIPAGVEGCFSYQIVEVVK